MNTRPDAQRERSISPLLSGWSNNARRSTLRLPSLFVCQTHFHSTKRHCRDLLLKDSKCFFHTPVLFQTFIWSIKGAQKTIVITDTAAIMWNQIIILNNKYSMYKLASDKRTKTTKTHHSNLLIFGKTALCFILLVFVLFWTLSWL